MSIFDTLNPPITQIASGLSATSYFADSLSYNTMYYWKVFVKDQMGTTTASPVWNFTTLPHANQAPRVPVYLAPADGAAWEYPTLNFSWSSTDPDWGDTVYYALYLGNTPVPPALCSPGYTGTCYEQAGLAYSTKYYWKVLVRDNHWAVTEGPVYSFTTRVCPWYYKKDMPSARCGFGTAVVNGKIYIIGGTDGLNYLSEVQEYDPTQDTWTRKADMPTPRSPQAVTVWDGKIYIMGGKTNMSFHLNNEVYDPASDSWNTLSPVPKEIYYSSAHAIKGKIYTVDPVMQYDIATNDWWDTTLIRVDTVWTDTTWTAFDSVIVDTFYDYAKSYLPHANLYFSSAVYNNLIYVMGGSLYFNFLPYVDVYHPGTNLWNSASDMISPANYSSAVVANGFIYVIGGNDGNFSKRVRKYDPVSDSWYIRSDLQTARSLFGAAYANNCIYVFGGININPLSSVEEYRLIEDPKNILVR